TWSSCASAKVERVNASPNISTVCDRSLVIFIYLSFRPASQPRCAFIVTGSPRFINPQRGRKFHFGNCKKKGQMAPFLENCLEFRKRLGRSERLLSPQGFHRIHRRRAACR